MSFIRDLIRNNSGVSSKSFFMLLICVMGSFLIFVVGFVLMVEVVKTGTIKTDLVGMAAFVGSITSLFGIAGATKCLGERNEKSKTNE